MASSVPPGVFAVQCPNPKCRKYMLVEEQDRTRGTACLLCKTPIRFAANPPSSRKPTPMPRP